MAKRSSRKKGKTSTGAVVSLKRKRGGQPPKNWKKEPMLSSRAVVRGGVKRRPTPRFEPGSKRPQALKEVIGAQRREMTAGYKKGELISMALDARIPFTNDMSEERLVEELGKANVLAPKASLYEPYAPPRPGDRPRAPRAPGVP